MRFLQDLLADLTGERDRDHPPAPGAEEGGAPPPAGGEEPGQDYGAGASASIAMIPETR